LPRKGWFRMIGTLIGAVVIVHVRFGDVGPLG
jgi:hypothetical protein